MSDGAIALSTNRIDEHALFFQGGDEFGGGSPVVHHVKDDDVRLDVLWRNLDRRNLLEQSRQLLGMVVIVFQSCDMMLEGVDAGGGEDAGLAHGASVHPAESARAVD